MTEERPVYSADKWRIADFLHSWTKFQTLEDWEEFESAMQADCLAKTGTVPSRTQLEARLRSVARWISANHAELGWVTPHYPRRVIVKKPTIADALAELAASGLNLRDPNWTPPPPPEEEADEAGSDT
jgi:hypothetical protein